MRVYSECFRCVQRERDLNRDRLLAGRRHLWHKVVDIHPITKLLPENAIMAALLEPSDIYSIVGLCYVFVALVVLCAMYLEKWLLGIGMIRFFVHRAVSCLQQGVRFGSLAFPIARLLLGTAELALVRRRSTVIASGCFETCPNRARLSRSFLILPTGRRWETLSSTTFFDMEPTGITSGWHSVSGWRWKYCPPLLWEASFFWY